MQFRPGFEPDSPILFSTMITVTLSSPPKCEVVGGEDWKTDMLSGIFYFFDFSSTVDT